MTTTVYLDTSVLLAQLLAGDRVPLDGCWAQALAASRLPEFEGIDRVHARGAAATYSNDARRLVDRVHLVEMAPQMLGRALLPFAQPVQRLDALHLATKGFLRGQGLAVALATYDQRLAAAAVRLGCAVADG